jgi:hypothetical protein
MKNLVALLAGALAACNSSSSPPDQGECGTESGQGCAPASARVDLEEPGFSNPTQVTNPLHPVLPSLLQLGMVDGESFRAEVTLLAGTKDITWNGRTVPTLISQYVSYLDGQIAEVAYDWYAQADDGSVWYFGEDVFNYEDGVLADTEGTWQAGRDGPAAWATSTAPRTSPGWSSRRSP